VQLALIKVVCLGVLQFWPLVALFNYRYVPLKLRVLVINLAAFCWSTFLITRSNRKTVTVLRK